MDRFRYFQHHISQLPPLLHIRVCGLRRPGEFLGGLEKIKMDMRKEELVDRSSIKSLPKGSKEVERKEEVKIKEEAKEESDTESEDWNPKSESTSSTESEQEESDDDGWAETLQSVLRTVKEHHASIKARRHRIQLGKLSGNRFTPIARRRGPKPGARISLWGKPRGMPGPHYISPTTPSSSESETQ